MPPPSRPVSQRDPTYRVRALGAAAASLAVMHAALTLWPAHHRAAPETRDVAPREAVVIERIEPTVQPPPSPTAPPALPPPTVEDLPPEEVPDDVLLEELDLPPMPDLPPAPLPDAPQPAGPPAPPAPGPSRPSTVPASDRIVEQPQRSPRPVRTSPPVCPPDVRRDGLTVRARVRVLVSATGQVETAEITERTVTDRRDRRQDAATLPYGLDAAVLDAARRHLFRPARDGDQSVRSYATLTLACSASG